MAVAVRRRRPARDAQPHHRRHARCRRCGSCARGGCTTWGGCSTSACPCSRGATSARRWSPPPITQNGGGLGANRVNWITEQIAGTQQLGTHLDALSHLQIGDRGYNGWSVAELAGTAGVKRLGVETVPQIVTRGWLVDVAPLGPGEVIGVPDIDPAPGDAVLFHTGWGEHWDDADTYLSGEPGPGWELAEVAGGAGRRAHRLRHLELRPGPGRGPRPAVRGPTAPQRPPRRVHRREPRHRRSSRATACASSR